MRLSFLREKKYCILRIIISCLVKGCIGRRSPQPSRGRNPKIIQPTTTVQVEPIITQAPTTRLVTAPEVTTTEKALPTEVRTEATVVAAAVTPSRTQEVTRTLTTIQFEETTTAQPITAKARTTKRVVHTVKRAPLRTRPTSPFRFQKRFGIFPKNAGRSTETCVKDIKGECRSFQKCNGNWFIRGKFGCEGVKFCCVRRPRTPSRRRNPKII